MPACTEESANSPVTNLAFADGLCPHAWRNPCTRTGKMGEKEGKNRGDEGKEWGKEREKTGGRALSYNSFFRWRYWIKASVDWGTSAAMTSFSGKYDGL